jgi:hypothetical protein
MTPVHQMHEAFIEMHRQGAMRMCASSQILQQTFVMNGLDARLSIIAAISSMGGAHAPLVQTQLMLGEYLNDPSKLDNIVARYSKRNRIPGFGSGFVKGGADPIHEDIDKLINKLAPKIHYYMMDLHHKVQEEISDKLYFNTAMYSAAFGIIMNISPYVMPGYAIEARLGVLNGLMIQILNQDAKLKIEEPS